jgi:adhesin transport system membrane fusion protein
LNRFLVILDKWETSKVLLKMRTRAGERPPRAAAVLVFSLVALLCSLSAWAAVTEVQEVTRGAGRVIPSSRTQIIQTSEAGVVREIAVRIGQRVNRGDLLLRLDDTPNASKAGEVEAQSRALRAQIVRLELEQSGNQESKYVCPKDIEWTAPEVCQSEIRLMGIRLDNLQKQLDVLKQRVEQRQRELNETQASVTRYSEGLKLAERELGILAPMASRNLVAQTELIRAQRQVVELRGQHDTAQQMLARLEAALQEANLQIEQHVLQFRREAAAELTTRRAELSVLQETLRGAEERVRRTDVRAPVDGIVNSLAITTLGAFVNPGDRLLEVVPVEDKLLVEARVSPSDIAFVTAGQRALIKVTAYDFYQYGGLNGVVEQVSADSIYDSNLKEAFYSVIIRTGETQLTLKNVAYSIIPGMTCDVEIITGQKSVLDYLLRPIRRAKHEALSER